MFYAYHKRLCQHAILFYLVIFCNLFTCTGIFSQQLTFQHLTIENGLSSNSVLSIGQDNSGFIWLGTNHGLARYDGSHFRIFNSDTGAHPFSGLANDNVISIYCDSKKNLWIGTLIGLHKYNPFSETFEHIPIKNAGQFINCIYEDQQMRIWIGTTKGIFQMLDREKYIFKPLLLAGLASKSIRSIYEDKLGNLWVGTTDCLIKTGLGNTGQTAETFTKSNGLTDNFVTSIAEDYQGHIWIGTQNGLNLFSPLTKSFEHFLQGGANGLLDNHIRKILKDKNGDLWVGTQEGLNKIDPYSKIFTAYENEPANKNSLSQNSVHSLFEDADGSIWAGTYFGGANLAISAPTAFTVWQNKSKTSGLNNNVVSGIVEDGRHNLWIGTEGGGLNYFNRATNSFTVLKYDPAKQNGLNSDLIKVLYKDREGNIWIGTHGGGLNVLEPAGISPKKYLYEGYNEPEVISLLEDSKNNFWVGSNKGLKIFHKKGSELTPTTFPAHFDTASYFFVTALFEDNHKNIWIGTHYGLYELTQTGFKEIMPEKYINCIFQSHDGNIWIGERQGSLKKFDFNGRLLASFGEKGGLKQKNIMVVLEDSAYNLWFSTENGLVKFDPAQKKFKTFSTSDGLPGNTFNYRSALKDSYGQLFFGSYYGFIGFHPEKTTTNVQTAPLLLTEVKLFGKAVDINGEDGLLKQAPDFTKQLVFNHSKNVFSIEFALLNFIKNDKNKYVYKLEGLDPDWNETTFPLVTYSNLPAGSYTFKVKGANSDGPWSKEKAIQITILPPWWLTWWAFCLYSVLLVVIIFLIGRFFFLRALVVKEKALHQTKLNFFTNISHEIRTHLTLIMAPVDKMLTQNSQNDYFMQQHLHSVKGNADRLLKLVNELMDFRKAETGHLQLQVGRYDVIAFLGEIYTTFQELSISKSINTSFLHNVDELFVYFDKDQIQKVFFNLFTNAFKFTPEGGRTILNVEKQIDTVLISITDNGQGIAAEHREKIFNNYFQVAETGQQNTGYGIGLALSKNIVELHKGELSVQSHLTSNGNCENETIFSVLLPLGDNWIANSAFIQKIIVPDDQNRKITATAISAAIKPVQETDENPDKLFTVLIVEDHSELRKLICETFAKDYKVLMAENGEDGLNMAVEHIPDLMISDVMMPKMSGIELCTAIKTDERTSHIPFILLTAKSSQTDQISGLNSGADIYLTKPFSTKALELNARNLLALRENMRQYFGKQLIELPPQNPSENETPQPVTAVQQSKAEQEFLNKVIGIIEEYMEDPEFGVTMLSKKVAMSVPVLYKKIKAVTGMSVNDLIKSVRLKKAAQLLLQRELTVYQVIYATGYNDRKHFNKEFKKVYGKTPSEFALRGSPKR